MSITSRFHRIMIHSVAWLIYILYETGGILVMGSQAELWHFVVFYFIDVCLFYWVAHRTISRLFEAARPATALVPMMLASLIAYGAATFLLDIAITSDRNGYLTIEIMKEDYFRATWRFVLVASASTGYWLVRRYIKRIKQEAVLKEAYLHARINAHLLFNTFNFIYNSIESVSPKASDAILLLSSVMQYSLSEVKEDGTVELRDEVRQMENYINLNQIRFNGKLNLRASITGNSKHSSMPVPPLLLMTFLENMFKHGNLKDPAEPAVLSIHCEDNALYFRTENKKCGRSRIRGHHLGLSNAIARLESHYGKSFHLAVQEIDSKFILDLKIWL